MSLQRSRQGNYTMMQTPFFDNYLYRKLKMSTLLIALPLLYACAPPKAPSTNCSYILPYDHILVHFVDATQQKASDLQFAFWRLGYDAKAIKTDINPDKPIATDHSVTLHYSHRQTETCLTDFARRSVKENIKVILTSEEAYKKGPIFNIIDKSLVPNQK